MNEEDAQADFSITRGFHVTKKGMFSLKDGVAERVCVIGIDNPVQMRSIDDGMCIGYEADIYVDGVKCRRGEIAMARLLTKSALQQWTMEMGSASVQATDMQVASLSDILRVKSEKVGGVVHVVGREGLDVIRLPFQEGSEGDKPKVDIVWAAKTNVVSRNGNKYLWKQRLDANGYRSDLYNAPMLENTPETKLFIQHMFNTNSLYNTAALMGWFGAAMICQMIRYTTHEFPFLHVFGPAGSGKSKSVEMFNHLFYYRNLPPKTQASGGTNYPFITAVAGSASLPFIIDEFKPRSMPSDRVNLIRTAILNNNYDGTQIKRGTIGGESGTTKETHVVEFANVAPIVLIGEGKETTTSLLHRMVVVPLTPESRRGIDKTQSFKYVMDHIEVMPTLGRSMLEYALNHLELDKLKEKIREVEDALTHLVLEEHGTTDTFERPIHNYAVIVIGLNLIKSVLRSVFGSDFDSYVEVLKREIQIQAVGAIGKTGKRSEATKVLTTLALMSRHEDPNISLQPNRDYVVEDTHVDLDMYACYAKYVRYQHIHKYEILYDTEEAFIEGMDQYPGCVSNSVRDNGILYTDPGMRIFRFTHRFLDAERVPHFKGRP